MQVNLNEELLRAISDGAKKFFEDPKNQKRFEDWKAAKGKPSERKTEVEP